MARKPTPTLTEAELRIMEIIWKLGEATVRDIHEAFPFKGRLAYNTVLTTVRILERKGHLSHTKDGRAHLYRPLSTREDARRQAVRHIVRSFFRGSPPLLLRSMLTDEDLTDEEIEQLRQMIDEFETGE